MDQVMRRDGLSISISSHFGRGACPCPVQGDCAVPAQGPHVQGYPGGHEHQELPRQRPQLSQQQGRVQASSHSENQKTSYSWAVNKWRKSHLFIFSLSFFTIHKFPFRIHKPPWSQSSEHSSLTDEIQRMKHVSKSLIVKMLIVHHKGYKQS